MNTSKPIRICCVCEKKINGRSDKVFCDISCKNIYHSSIRKKLKTVKSETFKILEKNHKILSFLKGNNSEKFLINKLELDSMGFNFDSITGLEKNKFGTRFQIFDFVYYYTKNQNVLIFRDKSFHEISPYVYKRWELNFHGIKPN